MFVIVGGFVGVRIYFNREGGQTIQFNGTRTDSDEGVETNAEGFCVLLLF